MRNKTQQRLLAFKGYDPYDTVGSWARLSASVEPDTVRVHRPVRVRYSEADANRWLRQAS